MVLSPATAWAAWSATACSPPSSRPAIPGILKCLSLSPGLFRGMDEVSDSVHFRDGHLTRRVKEMIATYVSALNRCPY